MRRTNQIVAPASSMALEVPNEMLGPGPEVGVWCTVSVRRDGRLVQVDRLTYGRVTSDGVEPHDDYLREFPFLGVPNAQASGEQPREAFLDPAAVAQ